MSSQHSPGRFHQILNLPSLPCPTPSFCLITDFVYYETLFVLNHRSRQYRERRQLKYISQPMRAGYCRGCGCGIRCARWMTSRRRSFGSWPADFNDAVRHERHSTRSSTSTSSARVNSSQLTTTQCGAPTSVCQDVYTCQPGVIWQRFHFHRIFRHFSRQ